MIEQIEFILSIDFRFKSVEIVGEGGFGVIRSAWDNILGRHVVIKLMKDFTRRDLIQEAENEFSMMKFVSTMNINSYFDIKNDNFPVKILSHSRYNDMNTFIYQGYSIEAFLIIPDKYASEK